MTTRDPARPPFRIGHGFDVHQLVEGRSLILGGVQIPHHLGLDGHSDADAVLHALCDALLGAIAGSDIGALFPNDDERWKGRNSADFVAACMARVTAAGYAVANADITIHAERPKLRPHIDTMRARVAAMLGVPADRVGMKAGTMEKMGFVGREEGIAADAVVLLTAVDF